MAESVRCELMLGELTREKERKSVTPDLQVCSRRYARPSGLGHARPSGLGHGETDNLCENQLLGHSGEFTEDDGWTLLLYVYYTEVLWNVTNVQEEDVSCSTKNVQQ